MPAQPPKLEELAVQLKQISEALANEPPSELTPIKVKKVRKTLSDAYDQIRKVIDDLDPIKHPGFMFDPSNPNIIGRIVGITLVAQHRKPLGAIQRFYGSGVYAIYYNGDFAAYSGISKKEHPIYVGKADPGRDWAHRDPKMRDARPANRIKDDIEKHLETNPPFSSTNEILKRFLDEIRAAS